MRKKRRRLRKWVVSTLQGITVVSLVFAFTLLAPFKIAVVSGSSMEATLHDKDILIFLKHARILNDDVVIFQSPSSWGLKKEWLIKRVVAKPGDRLTIKDGTIYVNNKLYDTFVANSTRELDEKIDGYFVMGDNRGHSYDSLARFLKDRDDYLIHDIHYSKDIKKK